MVGGAIEADDGGVTWESMVTMVTTTTKVEAMTTARIGMPRWRGAEIFAILKSAEGGDMLLSR